MNFTPEPIDTSNIVLTKDILDLTELLARNFHDIWALQQLNNGWRFGPKKDHFIKENPYLIPFEDMPESLKEFDR